MTMPARDVTYNGDDGDHADPALETGARSPVEVGPAVRRELQQDALQLAAETWP